RRAGAAAGAARRRRRLVDVRARARPRREPANGAARARRARGGRQCALDRTGARAALARAVADGIHDDLVTPCCDAGRVDLLCRHRIDVPNGADSMTSLAANTSKTSKAQAAAARPAELV